eukprot:3154394-Amphidinium_carterae.2
MASEEDNADEGNQDTVVGAMGSLLTYIAASGDGAANDVKQPAGRKQDGSLRASNALSQPSGCVKLDNKARSR